MSKVDFEYYPHLVDLIWEHIPASEVYLAGQVSSSWRERALKRVYRHLTIEMCDRGWRFWMWTADSADIYAKYFLPCRPSDRSGGWKVLPERHPTFSVDVAARYTEVLDLKAPTNSLRLGAPPLKLHATFSRLHTTRVHTAGGAKGFGATQVYFFNTRDSDKIKIEAPKAECIVLTITVGQPHGWFHVFAGNARLEKHLKPGTYTAKKLVIVFERHQPQPALSQDEVTRDVVHYLGRRGKRLAITVVGTDVLLRDQSWEASVWLKAAILHELDAQRPNHGVKLFTHEEYEALVGRETYQVHCVSNFFQWDHYIND